MFYYFRTTQTIMTTNFEKVNITASKKKKKKKERKKKEMLC